MPDSPPSRKPRLAAAAPESLPDAHALLPLDALDNILSRLHIYEVVRTSALSRAWRRRCESLPSVDLVRSFGITASDVDALLLRRAAPVRSFGITASDVDALLLRRAAPVRSVLLAARDPSWFVDAFHDWLLYLSRNGVQTLDLWFSPLNFQLHSCLFCCREITCLNLTSCRLPPAPAEFAGFPNLKTLHLEKVSLPEHGGRELAALITASPLLEEVELFRVKLIGDGPDDEWVIRAPSLRKLTIICVFLYGGRVEDLPRLEEAVLYGRNYAKFLTGMVHVTKLEFCCNYMLSTEVDVLERLPFLFENLRSLILVACSNGTQEIDANDDLLNAQASVDQ